MQDPRTLTDIFEVTCGIARPAIMKYKEGGRWVDVPVPEFRDSVRGLAAALHEMGVKAGDRVAILSENRPEWTISDFAILSAGAISVPVYPTLLGWQIEYILNDAGTVAIVCSNKEQLDKVLEIRSHVPCLQTIIVCDRDGVIYKKRAGQEQWDATSNVELIESLLQRDRSVADTR